MTGEKERGRMQAPPQHFVYAAGDFYRNGLSLFTGRTGKAGKDKKRVRCSLAYAGPELPVPDDTGRRPVPDK